MPPRSGRNRTLAYTLEYESTCSAHEVFLCPSKAYTVHFPGATSTRHGQLHHPGMDGVAFEVWDDKGSLVLRGAPGWAYAPPGGDSDACPEDVTKGGYCFDPSTNECALTFSGDSAYCDLNAPFVAANVAGPRERALGRHLTPLSTRSHSSPGVERDTRTFAVRDL